MNICQLDIADPRALARWDAFAKSRDSLYHDSRWHAVLKRCFGFTPLFLYAEEEGEIAALFPLFLVRRPLGRCQAVSLPHLEAGGILPGVDPGPFLEYLYRSLGPCELLLQQYREPLAGFTGDESETILVKELPTRAEEIIASLPSANARSSMRHALRLSYRVEAGNGAKLLDAFYRLYLTKMREFGTPPSAGSSSRRWCQVSGRPAR
jgi:hypothetical protein